MRSEIPLDPEGWRHVRIESPTALTQRSILTIVIVGGMLMATAIGVLLYLAVHLASIQHSADATRDAQAQAVKTAGFKNRSVTCAALAVSVGRKGLPATCLEREILAYFNPEAVNAAVAASTAATNVLGLRNRAATCEGLYALGVRYLPANNCLSAAVRAYWDPGHPTSYRP